MVDETRRKIKPFYILWLGQLISLFGSSLTQFAFGVYIFQTTGSATSFALTLLIGFAPGILIGPFAGTLVDRWNRRTVIILSDTGQAITTFVLWLLLLTDHIAIWHIYIAVALSSIFATFQFPASGAAITMLVKREDLGRASGMMDMARSLSHTFAPLLAGFLILIIGIEGIIVIDLVAYLIGMGLLFLIHIPQPAQSKEGMAARGSLWKETKFGFSYILERQGLLALLSTFTAINLIASIGMALLTPYILLRTGSEASLGMILAAGGAGGALGGLLMAVWGGPKIRVNGVFGGFILAGMTGTFLIGITGIPLLIGLGFFLSSLWIVVLNSCSQAIWQSKVPPDIQGRVFSTRRVIAQMTVPLAFGLAGPLADLVFEPALGGNGQGMGAMFVISGILSAVVGVVGFLWPAARNVERDLPDAPIVTDTTKTVAATV
jgi:DHA3 family macrolide efflux protein-like MFS transporter